MLQILKSIVVVHPILIKTWCNLFWSEIQNSSKRAYENIKLFRENNLHSIETDWEEPQSANQSL